MISFLPFFFAKTVFDFASSKFLLKIQKKLVAFCIILLSETLVTAMPAAVDAAQIAD
jgi:hypothetical protein